jgi:hypothetical protein
MPASQGKIPLLMEKRHFFMEKRHFFMEKRHFSWKNATSHGRMPSFQGILSGEKGSLCEP